MVSYASRDKQTSLWYNALIASYIVVERYSTGVGRTKGEYSAI